MTKTKLWYILWDYTVSKNLGCVQSIRPRISESNHRGRNGLRGDIAEVILAKNPIVTAAWSGIEPNADPGCGYKIGDAVRARAVAIRGDVCGRTSRAFERRGTSPQEDLGTNSDAVCSIERGGGASSFSIWAKDESCVHIIARLREHATSITVRVCNFDPDSRGQCVADAYAEKQLEPIGYRLTQERGRWPFLTSRLENAADKTSESDPPLIKQILNFLEEQLEVAEDREMTVGRFVTAANESLLKVSGWIMRRAN